MWNSQELTNIMAFHYRAEERRVAELRDKIRIACVHDQSLMDSNEDRDDSDLCLKLLPYHARATSRKSLTKFLTGQSSLYLCFHTLNQYSL